MAENLTDIANSAGESRISAIVAFIDAPTSLTEEDVPLCASTYRNIVSGSINEDAHLWVFGRDPNGEIVVYTLKVFDPNAVWQSFNLSSILSIQDPSTTIGSDEPPIVVVRGTGLNAEFDIFIRVGRKLYHYMRQPDSTSLASGWSGELIQSGLLGVGEVPLTTDLQVHSRPVGVVKYPSKNIHIFFRNENGALMELIYVKSGGYRYNYQDSVLPGLVKAVIDTSIRILNFGLPSRIRSISSLWPWPYWRIINVDNDIAGVDLNDTITYDSAGSDIAAISAKDGLIHVFQTKADGPHGLSHYFLDGFVWQKSLWSAYTPLSSDPYILENSVSATRWANSPFFVYVVNDQHELLQYTCLDSSVDDWLRENLTNLGDGAEIFNEVAPSIINIGDWVSINVFGRKLIGYNIVRFNWGTSYRGLFIDQSDHHIFTYSIPAISEFPRLTELFIFHPKDPSLHCFSVVRLFRDIPWHSSSDYYNWASGAKYGFEYKPKESDESFATASGNPYWNADMYCPSFDSDAGAAHRAAAMLHEATHLNKHLRGTFSGVPHEEIDGKDMDWWYGHSFPTVPYSDIPYGSLKPEDDEHSPYQIMIEFLADIGEFPNPYLASEVWNSAVSKAASLMKKRIIDIPSWTPGEPRPFR